jgi:hypothetical protein
MLEIYLVSYRQAVTDRTRGISRKIDKLRSWIPDNASVRINAIPSDIQNHDDFIRHRSEISNVTDGFEYLMKFNSDVVNKIGRI